MERFEFWKDGATAYNYEDTQLEVELALKTAVVKELHDT